MSKIAMIVSNPCTGDARVIKMAESAARNGHEVHVFATIGKNSVPYEIKNGVHYHRMEWHLSSQLNNMLFIKIIKKINKKMSTFLIKKLAPFFKYKIFNRIFINNIIDIKPDIIHAHDLICLPVGVNVANSLNAKIVYDAHELEVHRNPPLPILQKLFVSYVEKKYSKYADDVISVCKHGAIELGKHLKRENIHVLYNSPVIQQSSKSIRDDLSLSKDVPLIIYVGKVAFGRGVEEIIDLLPKITNIHFATIGPCDPQTQQKMQSIASKLKVEKRFTILPPVHFKEVVSYIKGSDIGIISIDTTTLSYRLAMPNKLFEMSFAEVPILAKKGLVEIEEFLQDIGHGKIIDFEQKEALVYHISKFAFEKYKYKISEKNQNILEEKYSWNAQEFKLMKIYERLSNKL